MFSAKLYIFDSLGKLAPDQLIQFMIAQLMVFY